MDKIVIEHLTLTYSDGTESLKDVSLNIKANTITVLFGPAGGGKSSLLRVLNRLNDLADVTVLKGKALINGQDILSPDIDVNDLRRRVGMVFSRPAALPLSIYENVAYGLVMAGMKNRKKLDEAVEQALRQSVLWDEVKDRLNDPGSALSGGQQQRMCLARVLALQPEIILLDEPTSALDPLATAKIEELLRELKEKFTIVIAPHNTQQSARISDMAAFFLQGELVEYAPAETIFTVPKDKRTQDYITGRFG
ncbi:phosphate ABC transporter ATP-binding protein [Leptolinea tardivitalis]|uniref:Phosphate ABC transporter ATP-binding protein n=1 Tax=Leptolinea tardivitalis TaxID=229920 RepID=A0A0P6WNX5_9CHLR|nr:phosphate ABC transporter ATP-binding protein [Leptolinea tardivitalis]KPL70496.1 phosphate ABC transporter ATP-binding protein [Leptolinea tardivitalis]GAP22089.1 phosphate ABC transporter ATP-binding protein, PhoT family [Leptolinea tardivitalis]